jgi:hypothetical protein
MASQLSSEDIEAIPYAEFKLLRFTDPRYSTRYRLKQSLPVIVEREDKLIICSVPQLHVYGCGDTMEAALDELQEILVTVYDSYSGRPKAELTPDAEDFLLELNAQCSVNAPVGLPNPTAKIGICQSQSSGLRTTDVK